jgi:hypothetical protein
MGLGVQVSDSLPLTPASGLSLTVPPLFPSLPSSCPSPPSSSSSSGKSYIFEMLDQLAIAMRRTTVAAALTGVACSSIKTTSGAKTLHSRMKVPISLAGQMAQLSPLELVKFKLEFSDACIMLIDEISFADVRQLAVIDAHVRQIYSDDPQRCDAMFGGLITILSGDLHQLPGVATGGMYKECLLTEEEILQRCKTNKGIHSTYAKGRGAFYRLH